MMHAEILATDLDGTLIPLGHDPRHVSDLETLRAGIRAQGVILAYVTGRHLESVQTAIRHYSLPEPDWLVADVGTTIYQRDAQSWYPLHRYGTHLDSVSRGIKPDEVHDQVADITELQLQESEKQGRHKLSFYVDDTEREAVTARIRSRLATRRIPYQVIDSRDPFNGDGLIDLLPQGVSKASALEWWCEELGFDRQRIIFAGDSGNDVAAFEAGYQTIIVGNADRTIAEQVQVYHRSAGWSDRLVLAEGTATSGVLEGCRAFGMIGGDRPRP